MNGNGTPLPSTLSGTSWKYGTGAKVKLAPCKVSRARIMKIAICQRGTVCVGQNRPGAQPVVIPSSIIF